MAMARKTWVIVLVLIAIVGILVYDSYYFSATGEFSVIPRPWPWPNPVAKPDFVAQSLTVPSTMYAGSTYTISFNVSNAGSSVSSTHDHLLLFNATGCYNWCLGDYKTFSNHPAGYVRTVSFSWTPTVAGTYYLRACADGDHLAGSPNYACDMGKITESNENNNVIYKKVTVLSNPNQPDLTISYLWFSPSSPQSKGTTITVYANVSNIGTATANNFNVSFNHLYPTSYKIGIDVFVSSLAPGQTTTLQQTWTTTSETAGPHVIKVTADSTNVVYESNENNNYQVANYTLT